MELEREWGMSMMVIGVVHFFNKYLSLRMVLISTLSGGACYKDRNEKEKDFIYIFFLRGFQRKTA
jgi:hypothetical protein